MYNSKNTSNIILSVFSPRILLMVYIHQGVTSENFLAKKAWYAKILAYEYYL